MNSSVYTLNKKQTNFFLYHEALLFRTVNNTNQFGGIEIELNYFGRG